MSGRVIRKGRKEGGNDGTVEPVRKGKGIRERTSEIGEEEKVIYVGKGYKEGNGGHKGKKKHKKNGKIRKSGQAKENKKKRNEEISKHAILPTLLWELWRFIFLVQTN